MVNGFSRSNDVIAHCGRIPIGIRLRVPPCVFPVGHCDSTVDQVLTLGFVGFAAYALVDRDVSAQLQDRLLARCPAETPFGENPRFAWLLGGGPPSAAPVIALKGRMAR